MSRPAFALVWLWLAQACLPDVVLHGVLAQRRPVLGRVVDASGQPVVAANVTLTTAVAAANSLIVGADVVTATTDARGRLRADVLLGRPY